MGLRGSSGAGASRGLGTAHLVYRYAHHSRTHMHAAKKKTELHPGMCWTNVPVVKWNYIHLHWKYMYDYTQKHIKFLGKSITFSEVPRAGK